MVTSNFFCKIKIFITNLYNSNNKVIQKDLKEYLKDTHNYISVNGTFYCSDFVNLNKILGGTKEDFLVYREGNTGGFKVLFDFTINNNSYKVENAVNYLLISKRDYIYYYQLNGKQYFLKGLKDN